MSETMYDYVADEVTRYRAIKMRSRDSSPLHSGYMPHSPVAGSGKEYSMNHKDRRKHQKAQRQVAKQRAKNLPDTLTPVPHEEWPAFPPDKMPVQVWCSKKYLVQLYEERDGVQRLSINRTSRHAGNWSDKMTWDELQAIKAEVGFGQSYAIEVYPRERDLVNVANMRHLWILPAPLRVGWFSS